jgi:hypothetical protein
MKTFTWEMENGWTFGVEFANGKSAALYIAINDETDKPYYENWTKRQAAAQSERFRKAKGDNWEHGHLNFEIIDIEAGKMRKIFKLLPTSV